MSIPAKREPYFSRLYLSAFIIALTLALAVLLVLQFAQTQYERELGAWQIKLNLIADSRLGAVDAWVNGHFDGVQELAQNPAVRGFVGKERASDALMRDAYLRNLLEINAEQGDASYFAIPRELAQGATVIDAPQSGVALLDMQGGILMASADMPPLAGTIARFLETAVEGQAQMMDITAAENGMVARVGFLAPVFAPRVSGEGERQTGWVFSIQPVGEPLFGLLQHPGIIEGSLENLLVREENGGITYLTPLADGTAPLRKHLGLPAETESEGSLASAFAAREPGSFAQRTDYRNEQVLVTGRKVPGTPWVLVTKVDTDEALAGARTQRNHLILQLLLAVAVVFVAVIAAWRHGTSRDATRMAHKLQTALRKAESREKMLDVITDAQPAPIFMVDVHGECCYANAAFAGKLGMANQHIIGKPLKHIVGAALAMEYERASEAALQEDKTITWTRRVNGKDGKGEEIYRVRHIPLAQLPMEHAPLGAKGVLIVEQDVTALELERERRVRSLRRLIETLVAMVDRRDPYAANHSKMVALVSRKVAQQMDLLPEEVDTAETAGTLMNIGKMVVPKEWLTKPGALNEKEHAAIRDSLLESATLLEGVEFDGPVVETLRQTLETWSGKGPQKLKGNDILVTARVVAVANAFVGMVSPRAYRKAMPVDKALEVLMKDPEEIYDRKVVIALANYIDNHGGRAMIAEMVQEPDVA